MIQSILNLFIKDYKKRSIMVNGNMLMVEVADSKAKLSKGLMGRKSLRGEEGMLFVFPNDDKHSFWMYGMLIPLDIIWMDKDEKVVDMWKNARPMKSIFKMEMRKPVFESRYALELNAGESEKLNIKVGDTITLRML